MPRTAIDLYIASHLQQGEEGLSADDVVHLQRHFGVSFMAMLVRLRRLGHISAPRFEDLKATSPVRLAASLGYAPQPWEYGAPTEPNRPEHQVAGLPKQYAQLVRSALNDALISEAAAEALGPGLEEFERYLHYLDQLERSPNDDLDFYDTHVA